MMRYIGDRELQHMHELLLRSRYGEFSEGELGRELRRLLDRLEAAAPVLQRPPCAPADSDPRRR